MRGFDLVVCVDIVAGGPARPVAGSVTACMARQHSRFLSFLNGDEKVPLGSSGRGRGSCTADENARRERQSTKGKLHPRDTEDLCAIM